MKPIQRNELQPDMRIRVYFGGETTPWGYLDGHVIDNGSGQIKQLRIYGQKKQYLNDSDRIGVATEIYSGDLLFLLEDDE